MQNRYVGDIGDYLKLGILPCVSPGYRSVSHGGYTRTRATIEMGDILATFIDQTCGGTMIQNCSMLWPRSYPRARGTFGHWKRPIPFPEHSIFSEMFDTFRWQRPSERIGGARPMVDQRP